MTRSWLLSLGISLGLTLFAETGLALLCRRRGRELLLTVSVNCLTNPPVVFLALLWRWAGLPLYGAAVALLEAAAVLLEGRIYEKSGEFPRPYGFSLAANALSFGLGLLLRHLIPG